jgi:hypothetical protein
MMDGTKKLMGGLNLLAYFLIFLYFWLNGRLTKMEIDIVSGCAVAMTLLCIIWNAYAVVGEI